MPPGQGPREKSQERKRIFLELVAGGMTLEGARAAMDPPLPRDTYLSWRKNDPEFKDRIDAVKVAKGDRVNTPDGETFESKRKRYFKFDSYWHHRKIVEAIESAPPMGVTLILLPPEHGKTTCVQDYVSVEIGEDPNIRITYLSAGIGLARKAVGRVARRLTDAMAFPEFMGRYGPFKSEERDSGKPWTADYFTVDQADHDEQDYTFEARGWKASIAGTRCDLLIVDDIQSRKNLAETDNIVETFRQDFITRVGRKGKVIIIGTRVEVGDFYEKLIDAGMIDKLVVLPAVDESADPLPCPRGEECEVPEIPHLPPLCPEMWDCHELAKRRKQVGPAAWDRNYQQKARAKGDSTFTEEMLDGAKNLARSLKVITPELPPHRILSLDPALGGGNVLSAWALGKNTMALLDINRRFDLARNEQIIAEIGRWAVLYRPHALVMEFNNFQKGLGNDQRLKDLAKRYGFVIKPHVTGRNKIDELVGVAAMDSAFINGAVDFPWGDPITQERLAWFLKELEDWRPNVSTKKLRMDGVMTMWFAWLYWERRRAALAGERDLKKWRRRAIDHPTPVASALARRSA